MSTNGGMDTEDVVHIYNGLLHKKERAQSIPRARVLLQFMFRAFFSAFQESSTRYTP